MRPQIIQGEEVVITAQMRGQLAAINQQITSNTIVNVVSEEKIKGIAGCQCRRSDWPAARSIACSKWRRGKPGCLTWIEFKIQQYHELME
jgi:hypothetical protein